MARNLDLTGYVRNLPDDSVYIIAQGTAAAVQSLIEWCKSGPPRAAVEKVEFTTHQVVDFKSFQIR
jgi:acylphosphatase